MNLAVGFKWWASHTSGQIGNDENLSPPLETVHPMGVAAPLTGKPYADHEAQHTRLVPDVAPTLIAPDPNAPKRDDKRRGGSRTDNIPIVVCQNGSDVQITDKPGALTAGQARQASGDLVAFDYCAQGSERTFIHRKDGVAQMMAGRPDAIASHYGVRRLTPTECERLQGFPEIEKYVIMDVCLDHQKNYVNVEIRSRKSPRLAGNAGKIELLESAKSAARSSYTKNQPTDKPVPLIVDINCGERIVSIHSQERLLWYANIAEEKSKSPLPMLIVDFVRLLVGLVSTVERIILNGKVESQANVRLLTPLQNGTRHVRISGNEITQLVKDAVIDLTTNKKLLKSIISGPSDMKNIEHNLTTSCSYVLSVITGYILPETLNTSSFRIRITTRLGWTAVNGMSDSARYRMLGNAVAVPVARWLGERITRIDARSTK